MAKNTVHSAQEKALLDLLGKLIVDETGKVKALLKLFGLPVSADSDGKALLDSVFLGLRQRSFRERLTVLLTNKQAALGQEDCFVGAIAGAVGSLGQSIGSMVNTKQERKMVETQASTTVLQSMLKYKAHKEALAAQSKGKALDYRLQTKFIQKAGAVVILLCLLWMLASPSKTSI